MPSLEEKLAILERDVANWKQAYGDARHDLDTARQKIAWLEGESYELRAEVAQLRRELGR